jgi:hypothetical protein
MSTCAYIFLGFICTYEVICCSLFTHTLCKECKDKNRYKMIQRSYEDNNEEDSTEFDRMLKRIDYTGEEKDTSILWTDKPIMEHHPLKKKGENLIERIDFNCRSSLETLYEDQGKDSGTSVEL